MNNNGLKQRFLDLLKRQRNKLKHREVWNGQDYYLTIKTYSEKEKDKLHYFFEHTLALMNLGEWDDESVNMVDFGLTKEDTVFVDWNLWHALIGNQFRLKEAITVLEFLDSMRRDYVLFQAFLDIWKKGLKHPLKDGVLVYASDSKSIQKLIDFCENKKIPCDLNRLFAPKTKTYLFVLITKDGITPNYGLEDYQTHVFTIEELSNYLVAFENIE